MTDHAPSVPDAQARVSNCRWIIVAVATLMSTLMYLDRYCVTFALTFIQEEFGLTSQQTAGIVSAFFWSYALAQIPSGWMSDRWGARIMLTLYILSWSLFLLLIGWSISFAFLLLMQLGHGLAQAGAYPTSAGLLSRWMPLGARGTASSIVAFGGRLGAFLAPILTAWLIVFFVPVEKSSLLTTRQVHQNAIADAARSLVSTNDTDKAKSEHPQVKLLQAMWTSTPRQAQEVWQKAASTPTETPPGTATQLTAEELETLTQGLNQLLDNPSWPEQQTVAGLNLADEAKWLLSQRDRGTSLTLPQTQRLNRLVLEALFPKLTGRVYVQGWRQVFTLFGLAGIGVALVFWMVARDLPHQHPWCNSNELSLIQAGRDTTHTTPQTRPAMPWGRVLRSSGLWLSSFSQVGTNIGWLFVISQLPIYLERVHNVQIIERGTLVSLPMFGGVAGMLLGGKLTDWMRLRFGVRWGRAIPMGLTRFGAAAAYIAMMFASDPYTATGLCVVVAFFTDLGVGATWAFMQDAGGRFVGVLLGFGNMWGNLGAAVAPQLYELALQGDAQRWNTCFLMCAVSLTLSGFAALAIDASKPIIE